METSFLDGPANSGSPLFPAWSYVATKVVASMLVVLPVIVLVEVVGAGFGDVRTATVASDQG